MKIVFGGAWALIALGIVLFFMRIPNDWVVFCVSFGAGILLITLQNKVSTIIGLTCVGVAVVAFVFALT